MSSAEAKAADPADSGQGEDRQQEREVSTIIFPYLDLDEGFGIAKGVHELGGSCQLEQLAPHLQQSVKSSGFRARMAAAKTFNLIRYEKAGVALTDLGRKICDPQQEKAARCEAFLQVPLYRAIYEQYKTATLPPAAGLESAMAGLGVAKKQTDKARQAFQRSAQQAGFFGYGADRLVMPVIKGSAVIDPPPKEKKFEEEEEEHHERENKKKKPLHPFVEGLLKTLPEADTEWSMELRRKWLQAAATVFELMYTDPDMKGSLQIEVKKDSAK